MSTDGVDMSENIDGEEKVSAIVSNDLEEQVSETVANKEAESSAEEAMEEVNIVLEKSSPVVQNKVLSKNNVPINDLEDISISVGNMNDRTPVQETFFEEHKEEIHKLCTKVGDMLVVSGINKDRKEINIGECIKIISNIHKSITGTIGLAKGLAKIEPNDKTALIFRLTVEVLNSEPVNSKLSPEVAEQIKCFADDTETLDAITDAVDWVNDTILDAHDNDGDGVVTKGEIIDDCVKCFTCHKLGCTKKGKCCNPNKGCCKGCFSLGKCFGKIWSCILLKLLCCNCSDELVIDSQAAHSK